MSRSLPIPELGSGKPCVSAEEERIQVEAEKNGDGTKQTEADSESEEEEELGPRTMLPLHARLKSDMDDEAALDHRKRQALPPEPDL